VHPLGSRHIGGDFAKGALLVSGELPGQAGPKLRRQIPLEGERHPAPGPLGHGSGPNQHQLQVQELVEGQPPPAGFRLFDGCRPMHRPQCLRQRRKREAPAERFRHRVLGKRDQSLEVPLDQRANDLVTEALGGGIDWKNLAQLQRIGVALGVGQDDELAGRHLPAVIEANRAGDQQGLPHFNRSIEEGLSGPDAFQQAAVVTQDGVKDPEATSRWQHALGHHPSGAGNFLTDLRPG